jgi:hypothetical protein
MVRVLKFLAVLALIGFAALVGYAYLGDIAPEPTPQRQEITIDLD